MSCSKFLGWDARNGWLVYSAVCERQLPYLRLWLHYNENARRWNQHSGHYDNTVSMHLCVIDNGVMGIKCSTVLTLSILKSSSYRRHKQYELVTCWCVLNCWMRSKTCRPCLDSTAASDLDLHCLLRHVRQNTELLIPNRDFYRI